MAQRFCEIMGGRTARPLFFDYRGGKKLYEKADDMRLCKFYY